MDNANHPDAKLGKDNNRQSASLYDMIPAVPQNFKTFGEWNKAKIMVFKGTCLLYTSTRAIKPVNEADVEKMMSILNRMREEDPTWVIEQSKELKQTLVHLSLIHI